MTEEHLRKFVWVSKWRFQCFSDPRTCGRCVWL